MGICIKLISKFTLNIFINTLVKGLLELFLNRNDQQYLFSFKDV